MQNNYKQGLPWTKTKFSLASQYSEFLFGLFILTRYIVAAKLWRNKTKVVDIFQCWWKKIYFRARTKDKTNLPFQHWIFLQNWYELRQKPITNKQFKIYLNTNKLLQKGGICQIPHILKIKPWCLSQTPRLWVDDLGGAGCCIFVFSYENY